MRLVTRGKKIIKFGLIGIVLVGLFGVYKRGLLPVPSIVGNFFQSIASRFPAMPTITMPSFASHVLSWMAVKIASVRARF